MTMMMITTTFLEMKAEGCSPMSHSFWVLLKSKFCP